MKATFAFRLRYRPGSLLLEVLIGISVFVLFVGAIGLTLVNGQESTQASGDRVRATEYAQQALEAARSIRDNNFNGLTVGGPYGVKFDIATGKWQLTAPPPSTATGYITKITITAPVVNQVELTAVTSWHITPTRQQSVSLTTRLTNWTKNIAIGNWGSASVAGSYTVAGGPYTDAIAAKDPTGTTDLLYVSTNASTKGFTIFNVTTTASPSIYASARGDATIAMALKGKTLYLLTTNSSAEIQAYDVTTPSAPSASPIATYDLPGSAVGTSIAVSGDFLFVGASGTTADFFSFNVSTPSSITALSNPITSLGGVTAIHLSGSSAYLSSTDDAGEVRVIDISQPSYMSLRPGSVNCSGSQGCYGLTGTENATAITRSGTAALVGRIRIPLGQEMYVLRTQNNGVPTATYGAYEASGGVLRIAADPSACYGFIATSWAKQAFQVVKLRDPTLPKRYYWPDLAAMQGTPVSLSYDSARDRLFFLTDSAFYIFTAPASTGGCT